MHFVFLYISQYYIKRGASYIYNIASIWFYHFRCSLCPCSHFTQTCFNVSCFSIFLKTAFYFRRVLASFPPNYSLISYFLFFDNYIYLLSTFLYSFQSSMLPGVEYLVHFCFFSFAKFFTTSFRHVFIFILVLPSPKLPFLCCFYLYCEIYPLVFHIFFLVLWLYRFLYRRLLLYIVVTLSSFFKFYILIFYQLFWRCIIHKLLVWHAI